jgi:hypothetical protein
VAAETTARQALHDPPFALYGVPGLRPCQVQSFSDDGEVLSLASLGHGSREDSADRRVGVTVTGPLHGVIDSPYLQGIWEERPESLALFHVVICNNPGIDGEQIPEAEAALDDHRTATELTVDGQRQQFELVIQGAHWGAIRRIEPDHAIAVCASNVAPDEIELEHVHELEPDFAGA